MGITWNSRFSLARLGLRSGNSLALSRLSCPERLGYLLCVAIWLVAVPCPRFSTRQPCDIPWRNYVVQPTHVEWLYAECAPTQRCSLNWDGQEESTIREPDLKRV